MDCGVEGEGEQIAGLYCEQRQGTAVVSYFLHTLSEFVRYVSSLKN